MIGLVLEDTDEELKDVDGFVAAEDDGVAHLSVFPKPFEHIKKANHEGSLPELSTSLLSWSDLDIDNFACLEEMLFVMRPQWLN